VRLYKRVKSAIEHDWGVDDIDVSRARRFIEEHPLVDDEEKESATPVTRCAVCGKDTSMKCSRCKLVFYCGKEHQIQDWRSCHKSNCKPVA